MSVKRLNYIGSKYPLLDWITTTIRTKTGWESFRGKRIGDLFGGTGVVSHHFRELGAEVHTNDSEKYSSIICHALAKSKCTPKCLEIIEEIKNKKTIGYITRNYSPYEGNERMFFTVENAMNIDGIREALDEFEQKIEHDEYQFLLASLIVSADAISNVPAVYGCYLKKFKDKAKKNLVFTPIHQNTSDCNSTTYNSDVLKLNLPKLDAVYLDPPYNERQYSKNYFPLNMIVDKSDAPLKGKTGIPEECFISDFCKKGKVTASFEKLIGKLDAKWIFLSYSSESLVSKDDMLKLLGVFGTVTIEERDYKRFKSFEYNDGNVVKEYIFCLQKFNK
jgi:adenine-specific DNA-methyltransferase